ncbi:MAG TPA: c-type cytochrome [Candidatus Baltobacteraceae bacterium]|jgi:mono/diheme cytochrome c family protein|nr:c-type cytochrome [Candidatus Baltobacteraceae bacterium]
MRNLLVLAAAIGILAFGALHPLASSGAAPNVAHGKTIFAQNCAACHGADGTGGVGPTLHGALKTPAMPRTQTALVAWVKNPKAPMPKLFPSPLKEQDVQDVAAYVLATFK